MLQQDYYPIFPISIYSFVTPLYYFQIFSSIISISKHSSILVSFLHLIFDLLYHSPIIYQQLIPYHHSHLPIHLIQVNQYHLINLDNHPLLLTISSAKLQFISFSVLILDSFFEVLFISQLSYSFKLIIIQKTIKPTLKIIPITKRQIFL